MPRWPGRSRIHTGDTSVDDELCMITTPAPHELGGRGRWFVLHDGERYIRVHGGTHDQYPDGPYCATCVMRELSARNGGLLTVKETARRLGVHENTVRNWRKTGWITGSRINGLGWYRYTEAEVARVRGELKAGNTPYGS